MKRKLIIILILGLSSFFGNAQDGYLGKKTMVGIEPLNLFLTKRITFNVSRSSGNANYELSFGFEPSSSASFRTVKDWVQIPGVPSSRNGYVGQFNTSSFALAFARRLYLSSNEFAYTPFGAFYGFSLEYARRSNSFTFDDLNLNHKMVETTYSLFFTNGYGFKIGKFLLVEPNFMFGVGYSSVNDKNETGENSLSAINPYGLTNGYHPLRIYPSSNEDEGNAGKVFFFELQPRLRICYLL